MKRAGPNSGFTLIEVLVTFLVIALGLLGLAALQVNTINNGFEAYQRALVTALVDDMAERLRMNPAAVRSGAYAPFNADAGCIAATSSSEASASLTPGDRASHDQCQWADLIDGLAVKAQLTDSRGVAAPIGATGCIEMVAGSGSGESVARVSVAWQGMTAQAAPFASCGADSFKDPDGNPNEAYRRVVYRDVVVR
jgi:type IV pilus assembly protein PilV